jgi:hypothetical protein
MKIIAVNIRNAINENKTLLDATKGTWKLKIEESREYDFVIGIVNGKIACDSNNNMAVFELKNIFSNSERVDFELQYCNSMEIQAIKNYISTNEINLGGFTCKYIN